MSNTHSLSATTRKRSGSAALKQMRREGLVPAVLYGAGLENVNLKVDGKEFTTLMHQSASDNILVNLNIEGESGAKMALIQAVQHDPLTSAILHADFHAVKQDEEIHASVPLELTGTSAGVKAGGVLQHQVHSLTVHCLPKDLPEALEHDITDVEIGGTVHISDLKLPEGVKAGLDGDVVVAIISEPKTGGDGDADESAEAEAPAEAAAATEGE